MKSQKYKFSIIIPTYNRSFALDRCLKSLVNQTFKNFEVLVCDDGSTDDTKQVIDKYARVLNLNYFYEINWGGPAKPRNIGITNANADWLCFLDSDDCYSENRLEFISNLDLEGIDLIYHDLNAVKGRKSVGRIKARQLCETDAYHDLLYNLNTIPTSSTCVRKSIIEKANGFKESKDIIGLEDFDLWIRLGKLGMRANYVPEIMGTYYMGDDNITTFDDRQINRFKALYKYFIDSAINKQEQRKIEAALEYMIGNISIKNGRFIKGYLSIAKSFLNGSLTIKIHSVFYMIKGVKYLIVKKIIKNE